MGWIKLSETVYVNLATAQGIDIQIEEDGFRFQSAKLSIIDAAGKYVLIADLAPQENVWESLRKIVDAIESVMTGSESFVNIKSFAGVLGGKDRPKQFYR